MTTQQDIMAAAAEIAKLEGEFAVLIKEWTAHNAERRNLEERRDNLDGRMAAARQRLIDLAKQPVGREFV
jgi:chromosome segregation ATPase